HHALSYCWGDEDDTRTVFVNGIKIEITRNLYEFLKMARQSLSTEYQHVLLFWVDAICINQRDADEKARQILQMPSIYRRSLTLLWM
ncbi:heterokaryon incompatibility, partial [Lojkania enalia]